MKSLRSLLAPGFAALVAASVASANQQPSAPSKPAETKAEKAACGCATGKDAKVCGVDKDCCCTGEKAKGRTDEKKSADKKAAAKGEACDACGV